MSIIKETVKKHFTGFTFFYRILRYRIFLALLAGIIVGVLDGFGLAMFLPLLQLVGGESEANGEGMGNLDFLVEFFQSIGLSMNIETILIILIVFFILKGIATFLGQVYQVNIRQLFLRTLRLTLLHDFNSIKYKKFISWDLGRIQNSFTTETGRITMAFTHYSKTMNQAVNILVYIGFAFAVDAKFAFLVIFGAFLSNFIFRYFYKLSKAASRNLTKGNSAFHGLVTQFIANFKYLKATGRNMFYVQKLEEKILDIEANNTKLGIYGAALTSMREPIMIMVVASVILLQTKVLGAPLAPIMISLLFFYRALNALSAIQTTWNHYIRFSGSMENIELFGKELKMSKEKHKGKQEFKSIEINLVLHKVNFGYTNDSILSNISLEIRKNETIALVGESGSGKTTLVNIISGLLKPSQGRVLIDGSKMDDISIQDFQSRVGFITQEPVIFNANIFENVTFWDEVNDHNIKRFNEVIRQAALETFLQELTEKELTVLGANGINLSGGQRQRIAIARELYRDIDILILDEATAALDGDTEHFIQQSIDLLKGKYTIITVAHRLATIKNADRVVLMDKGRILNILPFDQLVQEEPKFKHMVQLQSL